MKENLLRPRCHLLGGALVLLLGFGASRLPAKIGLTLVIFNVAFVAVWLTADALRNWGVWTIRTPYKLDTPILVETKISDHHWLTIVTQGHERYGTVATPNTVGHERVDGDYDVKYTIGSDSWRTIPDARPEVAFLGCSFTFGTGVQDEECFAAVLNNQYWTDHKVRNYALMGYGTRQACLILEDRLKREPRPAAVFYGWLYDHIRRNYLGKEYHGHMGQGARFPFFELVGDSVEFRGLRKATDATMPTGAPETFEKEVKVTIALLRKMDQMCREQKIPFFFVMLGQKYPLADDPVAKFVASSEIQSLDLRDIKQGFFVNDPHPNRDWHAATAAAIAKDPRMAFLKAKAAKDD
ncbi:MAG: hypothetical protein U1D30_20745 [Planctomycetota bacterium]